MIVGLQLENFRSYTSLQIQVPDTALVFLLGPNGAGKTNLLEAISLLGGGRGLRGARAQDLIQHGSANDPAWVINAEVSKPPLRHKISQALRGDGRLARLNQKTTSGTKLGAIVPVVSLTPNDDALFRGPAEDRRALLDRFIIAMYPDHRSQLSAFNKALRERNALLRQAQQSDEPLSPTWLQALESQMASHGVAIAYQRRVYLAQLASAVAQDQDLFPAATLALEGEMEAALGHQDATQLESIWRERWAIERGKDLAAGRTLNGPHRSDLLVLYKEKSMHAAQCSTGEQKALLLSLFLGQARVLQAGGIRPLLLLDEVAAHLDAARRSALMNALAALKTQTWMTGTDRAMLIPPGFEDKSVVFELKHSTLRLGFLP